MDGVLNVLLTAGVLSVILNAIVTSILARNARKKELLGLLRMIYVEIEVNRGEAELPCQGASILRRLDYGVRSVHFGRENPDTGGRR